MDMKEDCVVYAMCIVSILLLLLGVVMVVVQHNDNVKQREVIVNAIKDLRTY